VDCGITHNTAASWLSVLEASFILHLVQPYHGNFGKRLVKTPKLYFYDTGLAAWLLGIQNAEQLSVHPQRGALFESWVVAELLKARFASGLGSNLFFWRDRSGHEVDLLVEQGATLTPVEIKSGRTVARNERRTTLGELLHRRGDHIGYQYDFGDSWEHRIELEEGLAPQPGAPAAVCVAGRRRCPPEDCGGIGGFAELLAILRGDDSHERRERLDWVGGEFDPAAFDAAEVNRKLSGGG
jgi:hypothetical protein